MSENPTQSTDTPVRKPTPAKDLPLDQLDPMTLVARIKAEDPEALKRISDKRAASLVESALRAMRNELDEVAERRLRIDGVGTFVVRQVERPKDGQLVQRIGLNPAGR